VDGILIINKPADWTSHDVVARLRGILRERRIGHTGTLDPFATGVLVVLVGRATRLAQFLSGADKEYNAVVRFGYETSTGDITGEVRPNTRTDLSSEVFAGDWTNETIERALATLHGEIEQVPPMYSAKKLKGKKLYELARRGEEVERPAVRVTIHEIEALKIDDACVKHNDDGTCEVAIRVVCSAGTYVRTLAESIGKTLGVGAHLSALHRTRAGEFCIDAAKTLSELEEIAKSGEDLHRVLLPMKAALNAIPALHLDDDASRLVRHGGKPRVVGDWPDGQVLQMIDSKGELIGIGSFDEEQSGLRPRIVFAPVE
jgi:tRNA pseudouridine55 synthase